MIKKHYLKASIFGSALLLLMVTTRPSDMPVYVFIIPYILFFGFMYYMLYGAVLRDITNMSTASKNFRKKSVAVTAVLLTVFLAMQSIGQLTVRDVMMALLIGAIGYFYINRNSKK